MTDRHASPTTWTREDDPGQAVRLILDAAGRVFAARGVQAAKMGDVAREAGCSRGTLYRYFPDRDALRRAYVEREARRVGAAVARAVAGIDDARPRLVEAMLAAWRAVVADPELQAWFTPEAAGTAGAVTRAGTVVSGLVEAFMADLLATPTGRRHLRAGIDPSLATDWLVRVMLSLLSDPPEDEDRARALLEQFLLPALFR
jgi:AcrR family transcriptional regulator